MGEKTKRATRNQGAKSARPPRQVLREYFEHYEVPAEVLAAWKEHEGQVESLARLTSSSARSS